MSNTNEFLGRLVGKWTLTGMMGDVPLRQGVEARWALAGLFVEMRFRSTLPGLGGHPPYEAVYFVGYNGNEDVYVLHLLDTFGVATTCIVGVGHREGDSVPFVFDYASGPFTNRFVWEADTEAWRFEQSAQEGGETRVFAIKRMVRRRPAQVS